MPVSIAIADIARSSRQLASTTRNACQLAHVLARDPRHYQIVSLAGRLIYGIGRLGFELPLAQALITVASALRAQWLCMRATSNSLFDSRNALISALSLCLLLRIDGLQFAALAAVLAMGSKFVLRHRDKQVFNPSGFAIASLLICTDDVWVSSGQWGGTRHAFRLPSQGWD
jgi:Na+-transporting NADH:ubiquinone oxidoreductase subunit NqrB